jgi:hypothetical protein
VKVIPKMFDLSNQSRQVMGLRGPKRSEDETPVFEFTRPTAAVGRLAPLLSSQLINQVLAESETARPDPSQPVRPQSKSRSECAGSILVSRLDLRQARSESARTDPVYVSFKLGLLPFRLGLLHTPWPLAPGGSCAVWVNLSGWQRVVLG